VTFYDPEEKDPKDKFRIGVQRRKKRARALVEKAELVPVVGETQGKKKKQKLVVRFQKEEAAYEADQEQDEQNSQEEESEENKQGAPLEKQPGPSFATALQKLLKATVPEGEAPILAKYKTPFKKIEQQNKQLKEEATQKKLMPIGRTGDMLYLITLLQILN